MRGQHQEDHEDRETEGHEQAGGCLIKCCRFGQRHDRVFGGKDAVGQALHLGHGVAEGHVGGQTRGDLDRPRLAFAFQFGGDGPFFELHEAGHRHHFAVGGLHEDVFQIGRVVDRVRAGEHLHVIGGVVDEDRADAAPVQNRAQRLAQTGDVDPQIRCAGPVDFDEQLRQRGFIFQTDLPHRRVLLHRDHQIIGDLGQLFVIGAGDRKAESAPRPPDAQGVGLDHEGPDADDTAEVAVHIAHDLLLAAAAVIPVCQGHHDEAAVGGAKAGDREDVGHLATVAQRGHGGFDLLQLGAGVVERDTRGRGDRHEDDGAILARGEFLTDAAGDHHGGEGEEAGDEDHHHGRAQRPAQGAGVDIRQPVAEADHRSLLRGGAFGAGQQAAGQNGRECERDDRGEHDGHGEGEAEFAEEPACLTGQEGERDEHGGECGGGGDDGEEHLLRAQNGGGAGAHPLGPAADDVFQHDDGIIDDHAGGQNQCQ